MDNFFKSVFFIYLKLEEKKKNDSIVNTFTCHLKLRVLGK